MERGGGERLISTESGGPSPDLRAGVVEPSTEYHPVKEAHPTGPAPVTEQSPSSVGTETIAPPTHSAELGFTLTDLGAEVELDGLSAFEDRVIGSMETN